MNYWLYILYSPSKDKFYIGETEDVNHRLKQHNSEFYKNSFTKIANDWEVFYSLKCIDRAQARRIELQVKKMKSRKYYQSLKSFPDLGQQLLEKFK